MCARLIEKVEQVDYHRNGVGGDGFWVVKFLQVADPVDPDCSQSNIPQPMLAVVFDTGDCSVAVFNRNLLKQDNIDFMENSYRGDYFARELCQAINRRSYAQDLKRGLLSATALEHLPFKPCGLGGDYLHPEVWE